MLYLKTKLAKAEAECERLREENTRLRLRVGETPENRDRLPERLSPSNDERPQLSVSDTSREPIETRFIEVKGRAAVGEIALTANEYKTAQRLGEDYWLYVVFNCASQPQVTIIQNLLGSIGSRCQRLIATASRRKAF